MRSGDGAKDALRWGGVAAQKSAMTPIQRTRKDPLWQSTYPLGAVPLVR